MNHNLNTPGIAKSAVARLHVDGGATLLNDNVVVEEPLEIRIANLPFVVTMRTPGNDEELAAGFMTTEGFTHSKSDFKEIDRCRIASHPENTIRVRLSTRLNLDEIESRRYGAISASCGVCGKRPSNLLETRIQISRATVRLSGQFCFPSRSIARKPSCL